MKRVALVLDFLRSVAVVLRKVRLTVALLVLVVVFIPYGQTQDAIQSLRYDRDTAFWLFVAVWFWGWNCWYWSRLMLFLQEIPGEEDPEQKSRFLALREWIPRFLGLCPSLICGLAVLNVMHTEPYLTQFLLIGLLIGVMYLGYYVRTVDSIIHPYRWQMFSGQIVLALLFFQAYNLFIVVSPSFLWLLSLALLFQGLAFFSYTILRREISFLNDVSVEYQPPTRVWSFPPTIFVRLSVSFAIWLGFFVVNTVFPVEVSSFFGPTAIFVGAVGAWSAFWHGLYVFLISFGFFRQLLPRLPIFWIVLGLVLLFSYTNDNHAIRRYQGFSAPARAPIRTLEEQFTNWYQARLARGEARADSPYKVLLISVEGGGVRSAYWSSSLLARFQALDSTFLDHVFAISSVSGGSVGTALLVANHSENRSRNNAAPAQLRNDYLSPFVAQALYGDLFQRFIPFPCSVFDRARALERTLEQYAPITAQPFESIYARDTGYHLPSLFLNATWAEGGKRAIYSNVRITNDIFKESLDLRDTILYPIAWSTASYLNNRFPFLLPPATIQRDTIWGHIVDGGYFDNGGGTTLYEIYRALDNLRMERKYALDIQVLVVRNCYASQTQPIEWLNEVLTPIRSFTQITFYGRVDYPFEVLKDQLAEAGLTTRFHTVNLQDCHSLPLGLYLSKTAIEQIDAQVEQACRDSVTRTFIGRFSSQKKR
jgi:hypothetical protein